MKEDISLPKSTQMIIILTWCFVLDCVMMKKNNMMKQETKMCLPQITDFLSGLKVIC